MMARNDCRINATIHMYMCYFSHWIIMFLYVVIFSSEKDPGGIEEIVSPILQSSNYQTLVKLVSSD